MHILSWEKFGQDPSFTFPVHPLDLPSVSSLASLPFLSCCHRSTTTFRVIASFENTGNVFRANRSSSKATVFTQDNMSYLNYCDEQNHTISAPPTATNLSVSVLLHMSMSYTKLVRAQ